jgi:Domain of unknown function (DUF4337)
VEELEEVAEKIQDAAGEEHGEHDGKALAKHVGLTMAVLGVLLALCSALVGGSRTGLVATMLEQSETSSQYQSVSMKYRTLMAQLQQLHALLPSDPRELSAANGQIASLESQASSERAAVIRALRVATDEILDTVTPTGSDVLRFVRLVRDYDQERHAAEKWTASYADAIHAHTEQTEHFEWAQLSAEFGIVLASIALLLGSRAAWFASLAMGAAGAAIVVWTFATSRAELATARREIEVAKKAYVALQMEEHQAGEDGKLLEEVERIEGHGAAARGF